jgi:hypothetical protein
MFGSGAELALEEYRFKPSALSKIEKVDSHNAGKERCARPGGE